MIEVVQTPLWIDLIAAVVGGLAGATVAAQKHMDITGVVGLALATGLGGGILRDVLLNDLPVAFQAPWYILAALGAALAVFLFERPLHRAAGLVVILDAGALGLFGVVGADKALVNGLGTIPAMLVGLIAAVGGGVLRDMLTAKPPQIFSAGDTLYATAALMGIGSFIALHGLDVSLPVSASVSIAVGFLVRIAAWRLGWTAPQPFDATQRAREVAQRFADRDDPGPPR